MYLCQFFHFFCILINSLGDLCSAKQSGKFPHRILTLQRMDLCYGFRSPADVFNLKMNIRHCCDLRQMCNAEYLMMLPMTAIFSDTFCAVLPLIPVSISSKISVSIWSRSARIALSASMILEKLTARYNSSQWFHGFSGVCGNFIFNFIKSTRSIFFPASEINSKLYIKEIQVFQSLNDLLCESLTVFFPDF